MIIKVAQTQKFHSSFPNHQKKLPSKNTNPYNAHMHALPRELLVFLASMLPVGELRAAIPLGLFLGMSSEAAFFWAELGNILIIMLILKMLGPISGFLMQHSKWFNKIFTKLFHHTRNKHTHRFEKMGAPLILVLAAIPLPGTGGWTGALLAFLFDLPFWKSVLLILIGNLIAGILILLGIGGGLEFIHLLNH